MMGLMERCRLDLGQTAQVYLGLLKESSQDMLIRLRISGMITDAEMQNLGKSGYGQIGNMKKMWAGQAGGLQRSWDMPEQQ